MRIEDVNLTFNGLFSFGRHWLEWELGLILLPWEWEVFWREEREWGRIEACFGPFYMDICRGIEMNLEELKKRVCAVAERYDFDSEEIEQDITDAVEATRAGSPILEWLEREKKEGRMPADSYIAFDN